MFCRSKREAFRNAYGNPHFSYCAVDELSLALARFCAKDAGFIMTTAATLFQKDEGDR